MSLSGINTLTSGGDMRLAGTLTNNGTLTLAATSANPTRLQLTGDTTLTGTGETVFGGGAYSSFNMITGSGSGHTLTIGSGHTLRGAGRIGFTTYGDLFQVINQGTVRADGGTLDLNPTTLDSTGVLEATATGTLRQQGGAVTAETINIAAGGSYALLDGVLEVETFNGDFTQQGGTFAAGIGGDMGTVNGSYTLNSGAESQFDASGAGLSRWVDGATFTGAPCLVQDLVYIGRDPCDIFRYQLSVTGDVSLSGNLSITAPVGFSLTSGDFINLVSVGGQRTGTFSGLSEGSSFMLGGQQLNLTYYGGDGNDISLMSLITPGSVNWYTAGQNDHAYFAGTYDGSLSTSTTQFENVDFLNGSSMTMGPGETWVIDGGNGTIYIAPDAVLSANGVIDGNIVNAGLMRVPLRFLNQVTGGGGRVSVVAQAVHTGPDAVVVAEDIFVSFATGGFGGGGGGGGGGSGCPGCGGGGTASGGGTYTQFETIDQDVQEQAGMLATDASLGITGDYTQTDSGALRLFVGGNPGATFDANCQGQGLGGSYSQIWSCGAGVLDGEFQIVLQPELFDMFDYVPQVGDTFDFFHAEEGITLLDGLEYVAFVTAAGKDLITGLSLTPYDGFNSQDPDNLFRIAEQLFSFSLVDDGKTLRGTLMAPLAAPVPVPAAVWLFAGALAALGALRRQSRLP